MRELQHIKELIQSNQLDAAERELKQIIVSHPECDEAFFMLGNVFAKQNNFGAALSAYCNAIAINPNSPAQLAHDQLTEIMNFYHRDLYNP